jgi:hypothetical protein
MNLLRFLPIALVAVFAFGCSPLSSPGNLFATGRDGRSFNAATGRYEWSEEAAPSRRKRSSGESRQSLNAAGGESLGDGRVYDPHGARWISSPRE